jgi:AcrR family transcriptional regulator
LRELARRAGVSHNAPYRHFRDREDLMAAVATQGYSEQ